MATTKIQKKVTVLATYKFNHTARICFTVKSSQSDMRYHTCFQGNGRESCDCPSCGGCYHRDQLRLVAQAFFASRKPVAPVSSTVAILVPEGIAIIDKSELTEHDILAAQRSNAPLNRNSGFSLMR